MSFCIITFSDQIASQFPTLGHGHGYCGEQFRTTPSGPFAIVESIHIDSGVRCDRYECRGVPKTANCGFTSKSPLVVVFNIAEFKGEHLADLDAVPYKISLYGIQFDLAGYSLFFQDIFYQLCFWHGTPYVYDGMGTTPALRFKKFTKEFLINRDDFMQGRDAYYTIH